MNLIKKLLYKIFNIEYRRILRNNNITIPKNSKISLKITGYGNTVMISKKSVVKNGEVVIFGNNCKLIIHDNTTFNKVSFWMEDDNSSIIIGCNNKFCGDVDISSIEGKTVAFKNNCLVSRNVSITNGDSHSVLNLNGDRLNKSTDIIIGNNVWIGKNVTFIKNSSIGDNSIVGACSLVTKDYSQFVNCIVAGVPAKIIKTNVSWDIRRL